MPGRPGRRTRVIDLAGHAISSWAATRTHTLTKKIIEFGRVVMVWVCGCTHRASASVPGGVFFTLCLVLVIASDLKSPTTIANEHFVPGVGYSGARSSEESWEMRATPQRAGPVSYTQLFL